MKLVNAVDVIPLSYKAGVELRPLVGRADGSGAGLCRLTAAPGVWLTPEEGEAHPQTETLMVLSGALEARHDDQWRIVEAGDVLHVPADEWHRVRVGAGGPVEAVVIACPDWGG